MAPGGAAHDRPEGARLNGLGIGAIVVVGGAALLDVSPERAARSGTLTAIAFNIAIAAALGTGAAWAVLGVCFSLEPPIAADAANVDGPFFGGVVIAAVPLAAACTQILSARRPARTVALVGDTALAVLIWPERAPSPPATPSSSSSPSPSRAAPTGSPSAVPCATSPPASPPNVAGP
ncbi:hypothetical protein ACFYWD_05290 [Streptomyces sp. NPDC003781]|uniref:hypothetical protein n=1 Tax=Streptomyces sp. NPDC003781 TaxID=3364686 RepID=UPI00369C1720